MIDLLFCGYNIVCHVKTIIEQTKPPEIVVKYDKPKPEDGCYKDNIFYPRCKDLENPEVWHYHNLLKNP